MRFEALVTIQDIRVNDQGKMSVRFLDSTKDQGGNWVADNTNWASVAQQVVPAFQAMNMQAQKKPLVKIEGFIHGEGIRKQDGSFGHGYYIITQAAPYGNGNQNNGPAPAPAQPAQNNAYQAAPVQQPQYTAPAQPAPAQNVYQPTMQQPAANPNGGYGNYAPQQSYAQPAPAQNPVYQAAPAQVNPAPVQQPQYTAPQSQMAPGFQTPEPAPQMVSPVITENNPTMPQTQAMQPPVMDNPVGNPFEALMQ